VHAQGLGWFSNPISSVLVEKGPELIRNILFFVSPPALFRHVAHVHLIIFGVALLLGMWATFTLFVYQIYCAWSHIRNMMVATAEKVFFFQREKLDTCEKKSDKR
jgi:hypothetical protein